MRNTLGYIMARNVVIYILVGREDLLTQLSAGDRAGNIWMALGEIRMAWKILVLELPGKYLLVKSRNCRRDDIDMILDRWVVSLG